MKIITILGTRPEIIRLSLIIKKLDEACDHILVHTGQNYDPKLGDIFFEELGLRKPDHNFACNRDSFGNQVGDILSKSEELFKQEQPDRVLILGDTNSGLAAIAAKRLGIPVYHMEAGNRCFDDRVPEEVNRRIIDHSSDVLLPYTSNSKENLIKEGFAANRVYVTGNPIFEVIEHYMDEIEGSEILQKQNLQAGGYFLITLHRAENVDAEQRLKSFISSFTSIYKKYKKPVIISTHPRTRSKIKQFGLDVENIEGLSFPEPFGFFDFIQLQKNAFCVLSDSGTVQEESCLFGVPNVTLRDVTERPETVECGSNILGGADEKIILSAVDFALRSLEWDAPEEYLTPNVSDIVVRILLSYRL